MPPHSIINKLLSSPILLPTRVATKPRTLLIVIPWPSQARGWLSRSWAPSNIPPLFQRSNADSEGCMRPCAASLAGSSLKADSAVTLGSRVVFLFFNYFGHTACASTHVTHRPLMTDPSEAFLQTLITFQNNIRPSPVFEDISVCISAPITLWVQFQQAALQINVVQLSLGSWFGSGQDPRSIPR